MFKIPGRYTEALVMLESKDQMEESTREQVQRIVNHHTSKGTQIRIMADVHTGYGVPIGFAQTLGDYVIPNLVGVDIACGVMAYPIGDRDIDWPAFDISIRRTPHGFNNRHEIDSAVKESPLMDEWIEISRRAGYDSAKALLSCGSLGGGNHFLEVDEDPTGCKWIVVHSGSRGFGNKVAKYYQGLAKQFVMDVGLDPKEERDLEFLPLNWTPAAQLYLDAVASLQEFASLSRRIMLKSAVMSASAASEGGDIEFDPDNLVESVHNYIDMEAKIIRKGAISAQFGERVIIPLNMRDGTIIGAGMGSKKWNRSAPHGAGRTMSRKKARATLDMEQFKSEMVNVWSSCVDEDRLDEAPMAYKDKDVILEGIKETVAIEFVMKPVYNFKA